MLKAATYNNDDNIKKKNYIRIRPENILEYPVSRNCRDIKQSPWDMKKSVWTLVTLSYLL